MAIQELVDADVDSGGPTLTQKIPSVFKNQSVDEKLIQAPQSDSHHTMSMRTAFPNNTAPKVPRPLGVLEILKKRTFVGPGFNTIFRPTPAPAGDILQLNLTIEKLEFDDDLGEVPNRGLATQPDIMLNGLPYKQTIFDVTNKDEKPAGIHFEPGLWMFVPETNNPKLGDTLSRMASIPHGTTINAQGLNPKRKENNPAPKIDSVDITPFFIDSGEKLEFPSQIFDRNDVSRMPLDLSSFQKAGTITPEILEDPNTVLRIANKGKTFIDTTKFTVTTNPIKGQPRSGIANIAFLEGSAPDPSTKQANPTASAIEMTSTFWISTVQYKIEVPTWKPCQTALTLSPVPTVPATDAPMFKVSPPREITKATTITVTSIQLQYTQKVILNFNGLSWPHVSVATLLPADPVPVPDSAFGP